HAVLPRRTGELRRDAERIPRHRARPQPDRRAAVGDLLRRRRSGRPVAALRRHPSLLRRLSLAHYGLPHRQEGLAEGPGALPPDPAALRSRASRAARRATHPVVRGSMIAGIFTCSGLHPRKPWPLVSGSALL